MFKEYTLGRKYDKGSNSLVRRIRADFPGVDRSPINHPTLPAEITTAPEGYLRFKPDLLYDLVEGEHTWTIRYKPNIIRWPCGDIELNRLDVLFQWEPTENWKVIGDLDIPSMAVGHVRDWPKNHESIAGSGWKSKKHMVKGISDIYEPIYGNRLSQDDILVAYALECFIFKAEYVDRWEQAKKEAGL